VDSTSVRTDAQIRQWLGRAGWAPVVVAIDAPLVVANATGQRPCEGLVSRAFGRFGASCHTSNLARRWFNPPRGATLAADHGWTLDPSSVGDPQHPAAIEVYPHPAMVSLFDLDRVIPYKGKSGRGIAVRRAAFQDLLEHVGGIASLALASSDRWSAIGQAVDQATRPVDLDRVEDAVDAIFCAHLAWRWHHDRGSMQVYGDLQSGFIVTPPPPTRR
jgi:predicted RNase H-like nuclease